MQRCQRFMRIAHELLRIRVRRLPDPIPYAVRAAGAHRSEGWMRCSIHGAYPDSVVPSGLFSR